MLAAAWLAVSEHEKYIAAHHLPGCYRRGCGAPWWYWIIALAMAGYVAGCARADRVNASVKKAWLQLNMLLCKRMELITELLDATEKHGDFDKSLCTRIHDLRMQAGDTWGAARFKAESLLSIELEKFLLEKNTDICTDNNLALQEFEWARREDFVPAS
jgi:hypothetical protein